MNETELENLKHTMPDVQNQIDERQKQIYKVGIRNLKVPFKIRDEKQNIRNTVGKISVYASLDKDVKGTSMSRLVEAVHQTLEDDAVSLQLVEQTLKKLQINLPSNDVYMKIRFDYFLKKVAPVSGRVGYVNYYCAFEGSIKDNKTQLFLRVITPYTSLCPCSKEISENSAHNQRSSADVLIELNPNQTVLIEDIIKIVENNASCEIYSILKRPDEKYVTEKAYNNPKFVEDMARDIAIGLDKYLDKEINDYVVVINHYESIHTHDAVCVVNAGRRLI